MREGREECVCVRERECVCVCVCVCVKKKTRLGLYRGSAGGEAQRSQEHESVLGRCRRSGLEDYVT
jgi:hypothetical protein